jgi:glutamyl-tRNA synthetase
MDDDALRDVLRKYAVRNALDYGKAQKDAVVGKVFGEHPELQQEADRVLQAADDVIADVNARSDDELPELVAEYDYGGDTEDGHDPLPDLEDTDDSDVVLRFAPNPNGPPTLGSSRGMVINGELRDKYDGTLILRFDDTDPRTKRPLKTDEYDAYAMYEEDYGWLGYEPDRVVYSSKRFDTYIEHAERLIEMGKAYVCFCSPEDGRQYREDGEACPHRDTAPTKTMEHWEQMRDGEIAEGAATLKIKTDMQHKNPAIRDWVAFRIINNPDHPVTGNAYRVWPLLDFASAIEDHEQGTTHIVRGKDLRASTKRQQYIYDYFDWTYPQVRYWGRVNIDGLETPMSTSTLAELIDDGDLDSWDDPRAPTVRGLRRRGFTPEAIRDFWLEMGVTENDVDASMDTLDSFNRKIIDPTADRYFFVAEPAELTITDMPDDIQATIPYHPEADRGKRTVDLSPEDGELTVYVEQEDLDSAFLRLKDLCNVDGIGAGTATFHSIDHTAALDRGADIVQWVPGDATDCRVHLPDGATVNGLCEPDVPEDVVQFVRFGFVNITETESDVAAFYTHA